MPEGIIMSTRRQVMPDRSACVHYRHCDALNTARPSRKATEEVAPSHKNTCDLLHHVRLKRARLHPRIRRKREEDKFSSPFYVRQGRISRALRRATEAWSREVTLVSRRV